MKMIERAKAHYQTQVDEPKRIPVPQWSEEGGEEVVLYSTPLTLQERVKLNKFSSNQHELAAEVIILKAKDKEGNPVFTREDKQTLMRSVDSDIIAKIAQVIFGVSDAEAVEEAAKN